MREILEVRAEFKKCKTLLELKNILKKAKRIKKICFSNYDREVMEDLIDDIEISMEDFVEIPRLIEEVKEVPTIEVKPKKIPPYVTWINNLPACTKFIIVFTDGPCTLDDIEKEMIRKLLIENNFDKIQTSDQLGICIKTLNNKLRKYLIDQ